MDRICKILVVEDDDSVRSLLGDVLDHAGYEFMLAGNAADMRAAFDVQAFDVAIIDVSLRDGEDGFTLAEEAADKGCGIILTTGDPDQRVRMEASRRQHIMKPFRMMSLIELVDRVLKDNAALCAPRSRPEEAAWPLRI